MRTAPRFAMERLVALDRAIRAGEFPNSVTFADIIEVDPRTVQRDIEFLRDRFNAPVSFDRGRNGYYSNPDFRLSFLELEEGELIALFLAEGVLKQYAGTPYARDLASACRKIAAGITSPSPGELAASHSFHASTAVPVDSAIFHSLETAIRLRSRLAIRYYTASRDVESDREIDPYHIANIDGDFYLIAFCHHRQSIRTFSPSRIRARWLDRGIPQSRDWEASCGPSVAAPELPDTWDTVRGAFWGALTEASATTTDDTARFALDHVQLCGSRGEVVATDGRQLLLGRGWPLPWDDDLLVPGSPIFARPEWPHDRPISLGRTASHVVLRSGPGTLILPIRAEARYPDISRILSGDGTGSSELRLDPADALFLRTSLGRLPGSARADAPVTLELNGRIAVRARGDDADEATELVLARSTYTGPPIRLAMNRQYLARAVSLGLTCVMATRPDAPVLATDLGRTYAWQPLPADVAVESTANTVRVDSSTSLVPVDQPPPVSIPMPDRSAPPPPPAGDESTPANSLVTLIRDAESIHAATCDLKLRSARLTAALRRHRKRSRLMESTLSTLRQLRPQDVS